MDDWELLTLYAKEGSQEAFATLVSRHLNLVYSAARRQVRSPVLAEEIAQSVFLDLARQAARLKPGAPLASWLYVITRVTAQKAIRTETRRLAREQTAFELSNMNATPSAWSQLAPLLDEAVATLPEPDRSAIVLRFFENQSLREIGATLGISDDAAQKRVSRALDQLRTLLARRGVALTAAGLATDLSAHAIEYAPATLGAAISAQAIAVTATGLGTVAVETTQAIAMTTVQKAALAAVLAVALGASLYETGLLPFPGGEPALLREQIASLRLESARRQTASTATTRQLTAVRRQVSDAKVRLSGGPVSSDPATEAELAAWIARETRLRDSFAEDPRLRIPEMDYLRPAHWANAVISNALDSPEATRTAQADIRQSAIASFGKLAAQAVQAFAAANNGSLPTSAGQLAPYFESPVDPALLDRYQMVRTGLLYPGNARGGPGYSPEVLVNTHTVDPDFDSIYQITDRGSFIGSSPLSYWATQARTAYTRANNGRRITEAAQLLPYLPQSVDLAKLEALLKKQGFLAP